MPETKGGSEEVTAGVLTAGMFLISTVLRVGALAAGHTCHTHY
jgi:hypothetical protein